MVGPFHFYFVFEQSALSREVIKEVRVPLDPILMTLVLRQFLVLVSLKAPTAFLAEFMSAAYEKLGVVHEGTWLPHHLISS